MDKQFAWYFNHLNINYDQAWEKGILTLDANVLLNLYRYHDSTMEALLKAIESFGPRVWLSHQAASEFITNRKKVIVDAQVNVANGVKQLSDFNKHVDDLTRSLHSFRAFPQDFVDGLNAQLKEVTSTAVKTANETMTKQGNPGGDDPVLKRLMSIFKGRVGSEPKDIESHKQEARRRIENEIPPGFKDKEKGGDRAFGDYLFWRQVLDFSKASNKPIILVTSEQKPDWWEIQSGKILGPRIELLKELFNFTNEHFLIYQTDRFLEMSFDRAGMDPKGPVAEIREVAATSYETHSEFNIAKIKCVNEVISEDSERTIGRLIFDVDVDSRSVISTGKMNLKFKQEPQLICIVADAPPNFHLSTFELTMKPISRDNFIMRIKADADATVPKGKYEISYFAVPAPSVFD